MRNITTRISKDEYRELIKRVYESSVKEGKPASISKYVRLIIKEHINGSGKPSETPNIEVSEKPHIDESIKPVIQEDKGGIEEAVGMFDGLNLDL